MRLHSISAHHAATILTNGGEEAAFGARWQRWAIAAVKAAIFPAFFVGYAAAPRLFHRFMAFVWTQQCERMSVLINDIATKTAPDFPAHSSSLLYWGLNDDSTHKDELLLLRADAADAVVLHHHLADLLAAAPAKKKMNPNYLPQNELYPTPTSSHIASSLALTGSSTFTHVLARESTRQTTRDTLLLPNKICCRRNGGRNTRFILCARRIARENYGSPCSSLWPVPFE